MLYLLNLTGQIFLRDPATRDTRGEQRRGDAAPAGQVSCTRPSGHV